MMENIEILRQAIDRRVSTRKYCGDALQGKESWLTEEVKKCQQLLPVSQVKVHALREMKGMAPCHLAICVEGSDFNLEETGYFGEQLVLRLTAADIATCWIGMPGPLKAAEKEMRNRQLPGKPLVLIATGQAEGRVRLPLRKSRIPVEVFTLGEIEADWMKALDCIRQAPSATNSQPWKVVMQENRADVYLNPWSVGSKLYLKGMNCIDIGIALAHLNIGLAATGKTPRVFRDVEEAREMPKMKYKWSVAVDA
jgi:hypothetical protein